jgi:hypothetical protein
MNKEYVKHKSHKIFRGRAYVYSGQTTSKSQAKMWQRQVQAMGDGCVIEEAKDAAGTYYMIWTRGKNTHIYRRGKIIA